MIWDSTLGDHLKRSMEYLSLLLALFTLVIMRLPDIYSTKCCSSVCVPGEDRVEIKRNKYNQIWTLLHCSWFFSIQMSRTLSKYHDLSHAMIPHFGSVFHQLYHPNSTISIVTNSAIQILSILSCKYNVLHHLNITNFLDCVHVKFMTKKFINNKKSQCIVSQGIVCWFLYYNPNLGLIWCRFRKWSWDARITCNCVVYYEFQVVYAFKWAQICWL